MSRNRSQARSQTPPSGAKSDLPVGMSAVTPLKPRPKLLAVLSILFAAWISFLLVLYFTTVHHA
ncbi:MAG: hypothetical protein ACM359_05385 [Bacillota bacterium]